jgi:hypothetical protein
VALQGTLETFSLPDVLQLLSSTKKTGCLKISGDRGDGSVWLAEGAIVASDASGAASAQGHVDVVFELLRFDTGEFEFTDGSEPDSAADPIDVQTALDDAGKLLGEWQEIEAVVPSNRHTVTLVDELGSDQVVIGADTWKAIVAVSGGTSVVDLGSRLELGEMAAARLVKELSEQGLVTIGEPGTVATAPAPAPAPEPVAEPEPAPAPEPAASDEAPPAIHAVPDAQGDYQPFDRDALVIDEDSPLLPPPSSVFDDQPAPAPAAEPEPAPAAASTEPIVPEPGEAAEIARQLANLSPKAARAVAAAAKATTPEEREAALAEVEASDEQINRDLLLKFLGTVS